MTKKEFLMQSCYNLIETAFAGKTDKAGKPYIYHLYRVRNRIDQRFPDDYELELIALLHDLLEDCPEWTAEKLSELFSSRVVEAVKCLTKAEKEHYIDYIERITQNPDAIKIKLADLQDNMDVFRFENMKNVDIHRLARYQKAYLILVNALINQK